MRNSTIKTMALGAVLALGTGLAQAAEIKQGGEMIVTYKDDVSTLDPAIGYDWQNWSMIKALFNGLTQFVAREFPKPPWLPFLRFPEDTVAPYGDLVGLAPGHQLLAGEAAIGPEQDLDPWPAPTNVGDDAGEDAA